MDRRGNSHRESSNCRGIVDDGRIIATGRFRMKIPDERWTGGQRIDIIIHVHYIYTVYYILVRLTLGLNDQLIRADLRGTIEHSVSY